MHDNGSGNYFVDTGAGIQVTDGVDTYFSGDYFVDTGAHRDNPRYDDPGDDAADG